jgi:hypothetical protein
MGLPAAFAALIQASFAFSTSGRASCGVAPKAEQCRRSGMSRLVHLDVSSGYPL